MTKSLTLRVDQAAAEDVGKGRVRVDANTRLTLDLTVGDVISISSHGQITSAIVWRMAPDDEGKGIIRMDGLIRDNACVKIGESVSIEKADVSPAEKLVLSPVLDKGQKLNYGSGIVGVVQRGLFKRPVCKGDTVIVAGIALIGRALPFIVVDASPKGIVQITENTQVIVNGESYVDSVPVDDKFKRALEHLHQNGYDVYENRTSACPTCKHDIKDKFNFCPDCGTKIEIQSKPRQLIIEAFEFVLEDNQKLEGRNENFRADTKDIGKVNKDDEASKSGEQ